MPPTPPPAPGPTPPKTFRIRVSLNGGPAPLVQVYNKVPTATMCDMEDAWAHLLLDLNQNKPGAGMPADPSPRIQTLSLDLLVHETGKNGKDHPYPKTFAAGNSSWSDVPPLGAAVLAQRVQDALKPFAQYLKP